jgi:peptide/nickel transport system substrate-binding protein
MLTRREMVRRCAMLGGGMAATLLFGTGREPPRALAAPTIGLTEAPTRAGGVAQQSSSLIYARTLEAPSINPHQGNLAAHRVLSLVYDTLLRSDQNLRIVGGLAESYEQPNPTTYIFNLRQGVTWHNGRPFVAEDVKFSFEWILDPASGHTQRGNFTIIDRVDVLDAQRVQITLTGPNGGFPALVADIFSAVVPRDLVENDDPRQRAIGTGPYMLDSWIRDNQMRLVKNPYYYIQDRPYLDEITVQVIPDEVSIVAGLRGGTIHHATFEDPKNTLLLANDPNVITNRAGRMGMEFLVVNNGMPPFDNQQVRQALAYAIDRQEILQASLQGLGRLTGPLPEAMAAWALPVSSFQTYTPDLDRARSLLAEGGFPNGFSTSLMVIPTFPTFIASAQVIAAQLRRVNVEVSIEQVEYGLWLDRLGKTKDMPLTINATGGWADPDPYLYGRFHSKGFNQANWNEPEVDALLEQGRATVDPAGRKAIYDQLQRMLADEKVPYVWLYTPDLFDITQTSVQGFWQHPSSFLFGLADTWMSA